MNNIGPTFVIVVGGIITLAMVAVVVSKNANTPAVFQGAGTALASIIGAAVAPVTGSTSNMLGSNGTPTGGTSV